MRPDVTIISYGFLNASGYIRSLRELINVPSEVGYDLPPPERRDLLAAANPNRPFYVLGDRLIHANGPQFHALVTGVVSQIVPYGARIDSRTHYRHETQLMSAPGFGRVSANWWRSNGFGPVVREYYAGGFFSAGLDAERLSKRANAIAWYHRAQRYFPDPLIAQRLSALQP